MALGAKPWICLQYRSNWKIKLNHAPQFSGQSIIVNIHVKAGERFQFGANWWRFLGALNEERIATAEQSLKHMLGRTSLEGLKFVDVGCGSGLFSLAARRLGAEVVSFDFDPQSVRCAEVLRSKFFAHDEKWTVREGSVLDAAFIDGLGRFDIVYSWGVLHHTGAMWDGVCSGLAGMKLLYSRK